MTARFFITTLFSLLTLILIAGDVAGLHLVQELRVADALGTRRRAVELLEDREHDQQDHGPDGDFGKPGVVHRWGSLATPRSGRLGGASAGDSRKVKPRRAWLYANAAQPERSPPTCRGWPWA